MMILRATRSVLLLAAGFFAARAGAVQVDVSFPYAFHGWNTVGTSVAIGHSFLGNDFLGLEWTRFNPKPLVNYAGYGPVRVDEQIEAIQLAYRYSLPLLHLGVAGEKIPLGIYIGAGAGVGRVRQSIADSSATQSAFGSQLSATNTELTGELLAGVQVGLGRNFGVRVGYRYVDTFNNVEQFGRGVNTDTKTLELGAFARF